jgi:hypothetical protein
MPRKLYAARLLHVAIVADTCPRRRNLCDETVTLFRASSDLDAWRRALKIGRAAQHEYRNVRGQLVRWVFAEVTAITAVNRTLDGAEISSRLHDRVFPKPITLRSRFSPERRQPQWA